MCLKFDGYFSIFMTGLYVLSYFGQFFKRMIVCAFRLFTKLREINGLFLKALKFR